ncbi:MAG: hypothetical protein MJY89_04070 [Bacteroidales bacterium]|nr:hypothetical protein [Bacteroidales bacterium]
MISGIPVEAMAVDQNLIPDADTLTKGQTLSRVHELGWNKIGFKSLFRMLLNMATMNNKSYVMEVREDEIAGMREESGAGTNAVLCHYAIGKLLDKLPSKERFTLLEVADLRGRASKIYRKVFAAISHNPS